MSRTLPGGSSAFAQVMSEIVVHPAEEIADMDVDRPDNHKQRRRSSTTNAGKHHEEGMLVHGLHHCYKVDGGQCLTSFRCNHDHCRASHGHLEEISKTAAVSPASRRRLSIMSSGSNLLTPGEESLFRPRANSDANRGRRGSVLSNGGNTGHGSPEKNNSPVISPAPRRRGSNVALHSEALHHVYDQFLTTNH